MTNSKYLQNINAIEDLETPEAIIFDWDNTLVDTWPIIQKAIDNTMISMKKAPWGLEKVRDNVHKSMRESFPAIFGTDWEKAGEIYKNEYQNNAKGIRLLPLTSELLELLNRKNILSLVVSNKIGSSLRKEVSALKLDNMFAKVVGAQDAIFDKPYPHPAKMAIEDFAEVVKNKNIWFIGDTIADIECAYYCKMQPILFTSSLESISKTIPQTLLESTNFVADFKKIANHPEFIPAETATEITTGSQGFCKYLPVICGYEKLINKLS